MKRQIKRIGIIRLFFSEDRMTLLFGTFINNLERKRTGFLILTESE